MSDKVYIITKGDYSDYHICTVTLDKDRAEKLVKLFSERYDKARIEEYTLNETIERAVYPGYFYCEEWGMDLNTDKYKPETFFCAEGKERK